VEVDGRAAHQLDGDPGFGGGRGDPFCFSDDIGDGGGLSGQLIPSWTSTMIVLRSVICSIAR
jgi:hypothetical protein